MSDFHTINNRATSSKTNLSKWLFAPIATMPVLAQAIDPSTSVGVSSSEAYSLKSLFEQFFKMFDSFTTALAWFGVFIGVFMFIHSLVSIVQISNSKKQGSIAMCFVEMLIGLILVSVLFWIMFGVDFVQGFVKGS